MKYALITVSGGIIEKVCFYNDPSLAIAVLADYVNTMDLERDDAAVYGPDGLIANAKIFLNEEETGPIYIIANPWHSLGFLVISHDEPLGYDNLSKALFDLEKMRKGKGDSANLYKLEEITRPVIKRTELERYNAGHGEGEKDFDYSLVQEYLI